MADSSARIGEDPVSKRKVGKATAIIAIHPDKNGKVMYFGSKGILIVISEGSKKSAERKKVMSF